MAANAPLRTSLGFNLPFSGDNLLNSFDFVQLTNGGTKITAAKSDFLGGNGGATSFNAAGVKLFNAGAPNPNSTLSYSGNGTKFFSTPTADSSQSVAVVAGGAGGATLKVTQNAATNNQTLANKLAGLTTEQALLLAGAAGAGLLLLAYLFKG